MKINRWVKIVFSGLTVVLGVPLAANYSAVSERWGWSTAVADVVAPKQGPSPLVEMISTPWFLASFLLALGVAIGIWIDSVTRTLDRRRANKHWWDGLHSYTVRAFSCIVADVPEKDFDHSARAKAVASEILMYVNSGHMPTAMEAKSAIPNALSIQDYAHAAPYAIKNVGPEASVFRRDLEGLARARKWKLPWPIPPKATVGTPLIDPFEVSPRTGGGLGAILQQAIKDSGDGRGK